MSSDLFISYSRKDDVLGFVSALHDELESDYQTLTGRKIEVFFDREDIRLFQDWRDTILAHLQSSRLFLACLSPDYFRSEPCRWEWAEWIKHELARGQYGAGIATIYFITPSALTAPEKAEAVRWMEDLKRRHGISFAPWQPEGRQALQLAETRERLRQVSEHLRDKLDLLDLDRDVPGNLDAANPGFVGRLRELAALHRLVRLGPVGVTTAVQGLGGMGKTALALHYAYAYGREYPGGRWQLRCASQHDLATVVTQINETLQLTWTEAEAKDNRAQAVRLLGECRKLGHTLIILDNVDVPSLLAAAQTSSLLQGDWLHTLFTTRCPRSDFPGLPSGSEFLALDQLDPADALDLIRQYQPQQQFADPQEEAAAVEIIEALGGITLAVETAAIYLGQHHAQITPSAYLTRLRVDLLSYHDKAARSVEGAVRHGNAEVTATLRPTLDTLTPAARTVLALAALSAPDAVILPWLRELAGQHHPELIAPPQIGELDAWTETITRLIALRLLRPTEEPRVLAMHRVIQEVVRVCHAQPLDALEARLHDHAWTRAKFLWEGWVQHENRWELLPLATTAEFWMSQPGGMGRRLAGQLSGPLQQLLHFGKKESLLVAALHTLLPDQPGAVADTSGIVRRLAELPQHEDASSLLNNLARLLLATNRLGEAEPLMGRVIAISETSLGENHPNVAVALNNLAQLLQATNRLVEAEPLMRRVIAIFETSLGANHPNVATALNNLAQLLQATNRLGEAEPLMRRALAIDEASFGSQHPSVATDLNNLAQLLQATNRLGEAEPLMRRALAIDEASFGPQHPEVATDLNNLAQLLKATNRLGEAEPLMRRALAIDEASFGPQHPEVATALNNLAQLLQATNRLGEAEPLMRRALAIDEASFGPQHPNVATALNNLATLLQATNRLGEAEPLMRRVIAIFETSLGANHPNVAAALNNLATLLQATNRLGEAEPLMRRALAIDEASFGPQHPEVATDLNNLAQLLRATNRLVEAEPLMRRMVLIFLRVTVATGHPHPHLGAALQNYANVLHQWKGEEAMWPAIVSLGPEAGMEEDRFREILEQAFGGKA
jgi:tetratricopeptide (TPR) repeat protein